MSAGAFVMAEPQRGRRRRRPIGERYRPAICLLAPLALSELRGRDPDGTPPPTVPWSPPQSAPDSLGPIPASSRGPPSRALSGPPPPKSTTVRLYTNGPRVSTQWSSEVKTPYAMLLGSDRKFCGSTIAGCVPRATAARRCRTPEVARARAAGVGTPYRRYSAKRATGSATGTSVSARCRCRTATACSTIVAKANEMTTP